MQVVKYEKYITAINTITKLMILSISNMKTKFLILLFMLVFNTSSLLASDNYPFSIGASIMGKMGVSATTTPVGMQNALSFLEGVDASLMAYMPMSDDSRTGMFLEIGYTNTPFGIKLYQGATSYYNQKWLTISPVLLVSGVEIGIEFGFDAFDDVVDKNGMFGNTPRKPDFNVNLRIGYMYPMLTSSLGTLNFVAHGTYNVTGSDYWTNPDFSYTPVTLSLGLNYLFNLSLGEY